MKLKNIFLIFAITAFSCLFYQQSAGVNLLIFNLLLIIFSGSSQPELLKNRNWQIVTLGAVITSAMTVLHSSDLAVVTNLTSLILLTGISFNAATSLYISAFHGVISLFVPFFTNIIQYIIQLSDSKTRTKKGIFSFRKTSIYIIPLTVTLVFYGLYASANPVFADLIKIPSINISFSLVSFTFLGWVILSGFFFPFGNEKLVEWDTSKKDTLSRIRLKMKRHFESMALKLENKKGVIMLVMLNILLLIFNVFDFSFILSGKKLPDGMDYSEYVHQGINTLIFSILLAISIILYYFRGNQNFYQNNQWLVRLTYLWIFQNGLLLLGIIHKNQIYIEEFGLTYKRIGVYVYLFMTFAGLLTTFWKVNTQKSVWFLFRKNTLIAYILLITSSFINWDSLIAKYNINTAKQLDVAYLLNLSDTVLPELQSLLKKPNVNLSTSVRDYTQNGSTADYYRSTPIITERQFIENHIIDFKKRYKNKAWQSWNYDDLRVFKAINQGKI
ncbi:MAG: DUF4173 domain-containing protein [Arcicella sp.]|jgi:hypothetical protein|nr:DUF4173 domain-containing protein [Arcicella sp.]